MNLHNAQNRVLAVDFYSPINVPPFRRSAMDGYAVVASDTKDASATSPAALEVVGKVAAGDSAKYVVSKGRAVAIATGARVPEGADAVVMVENTTQTGKTVNIHKGVEAGKNVSEIGEDLKLGKLLLKKGTWLRAQDVGLAASVGAKELEVFCKPNVAVFSTGSELVEVGSKLCGDASIYDSNRYMLSALISEYGGQPVDLGICIDDPAHIEAALKDALQYDAVVMSGGSSVGEKDYAPQVINSLGKPGVIVHGVAMRPGSPTGLSLVTGKPVINCPGYPVAAYFAFLTFGKPLLYALLHTSGVPQPHVTAELTENVKLNLGMRTFLRVKISVQNTADGAPIYLAKPVSAAAASLLSTLTDSDAVIIVDNKTELKKGEKTPVTLLRPLDSLEAPK